MGKRPWVVLAYHAVGDVAPEHDPDYLVQAPDKLEWQLRRLVVRGYEFVTASEFARRLRANPPRAVVTCARGSSDHAATFAKYLIETRTGVLTSSAGLSVSSVYAAAQNMDGVLYLAISQSGKRLRDLRSWFLS